MTAFKEGLREIGIIEGQNVAIEDRAADGHYDRVNIPRQSRGL
jgi:hypothetical protein